jgi:hypothetical protein
VDALEKKVDQLSKGKSSPARKTTTRRTSAPKPAAKPKPTGSGGNA